MERCEAPPGEILGERFSERNILIVTDKGLHKAGVLDHALASLEKAGFGISVFDDVVADPRDPCCLPASSKRNRWLRHRARFGRRFVHGYRQARSSAACLSEQELSELYGIGKVQGSRLPLIQIPTTAGTGSEVTNITILTTGETTKMGVVARQLYAIRYSRCRTDLACLPCIQPQPASTPWSTPIEAYTSRIRRTRCPTHLHAKRWKLFSANLIAACENGNDRHAREAMLLGANYAGQAFSTRPSALFTRWLIRLAATTMYRMVFPMR